MNVSEEAIERLRAELESQDESYARLRAAAATVDEATMLSLGDEFDARVVSLVDAMKFVKTKPAMPHMGIRV